MLREPNFPAGPANIEFRQVRDDELTSLGADPRLNLGVDFVAGAIERGDTMFGAYDEAGLVSYVWRARAWAPHVDGLRVRVEPPFCYCYNSYTVPEYRGRRISPTVHLYSDSRMVDEGYTYRAGFVALTNLESIAMGKHMGSVPIGYAGYTRWFGRYRPFRTPAVRRVGFEFYVPDPV